MASLGNASIGGRKRVFAASFGIDLIMTAVYLIFGDFSILPNIVHVLAPRGATAKSPELYTYVRWRTPQLLLLERTPQALSRFFREWPAAREFYDELLRLP